MPGVTKEGAVPQCDDTARPGSVSYISTLTMLIFIILLRLCGGE